MTPKFASLRRSAQIACAALLLMAGCSTKPASGPAAEKPRVESDLSRTTISAQAAKSLGIRSEPVRNQTVQERIRLTGWVTPRQGKEVTVTAPLAGVLREPKKGAVLEPGSVVASGRELFRLEPVLTPLEDIQLVSLRRSVENELAKARENVTLSESELSRISELHKQKLRGSQDVEQAETKAKVAKEDLAAAEHKYNQFAGLGKGQTLPPIPIVAPMAGTVLTVSANAGQFVTPGAALATFVDLSKPWVRVPISESDWPRVQRDQPALT